MHEQKKSGGIKMEEVFDYTEVPYLQEILAFLPINPEDEEDVNGYIQNINNLIAINYKYEQYQFSYFGLHLLYMTYIYSVAWQISQIEPERYKDAIVFARAYNGRERDLKIEDAESIFAFSLMPEKDISKLFKIIDLDQNEIANVCDLVDSRNDMAHASGRIQLTTADSFEVKAYNVLASMIKINKCLEKLVRRWYAQVLISFCKGEYDGYNEPIDLITEYMLQSFKLSINELLICNDMSISSLITEHRGYEKKLKAFKKALSEYCQNAGYI